MSKQYNSALLSLTITEYKRIISNQTKQFYTRNKYDIKEGAPVALYITDNYTDMPRAKAKATLENITHNKKEKAIEIILKQNPELDEKYLRMNLENAATVTIADITNIQEYKTPITRQELRKKDNGFRASGKLVNLEKHPEIKELLKLE